MIDVYSCRSWLANRMNCRSGCVAATFRTARANNKTTSNSTPYAAAAGSLDHDYPEVVPVEPEDDGDCAMKRNLVFGPAVAATLSIATTVALGHSGEMKRPIR